MAFERYWVTVPEAADYARVSLHRLRGWIDSGRLASIPVDPGPPRLPVDAHYVHVPELDEFLLSLKRFPAGWPRPRTRARVWPPEDERRPLLRLALGLSREVPYRPPARTAPSVVPKPVKRAAPDASGSPVAPPKTQPAPRRPQSNSFDLEALRKKLERGNDDGA